MYIYRCVHIHIYIKSILRTYIRFVSQRFLAQCGHTIRRLLRAGYAHLYAALMICKHKFFESGFRRKQSGYHGKNKKKAALMTCKTLVIMAVIMAQQSAYHQVSGAGATKRLS